MGALDDRVAMIAGAEHGLAGGPRAASPPRGAGLVLVDVDTTD